MATGFNVRAAVIPAASRKSAGTGYAQESDAFSDDSGVDLRPQSKKKAETEALNLCLPESRRNKRKSSEPKRRKDVLQMKRFRWDTDEENDNDTVDIVGSQSGSELDDAFDEGERPSSGDSGCLVDPEPPRKRRSKKVAIKPSTVIEEEELPLDFTKPLIPGPTHRQSVIRKRGSTVPSAITPTNLDMLNMKTHNELLVVPNSILRGSRGSVGSISCASSSSGSSSPSSSSLTKILPPNSFFEQPAGDNDHQQQDDGSVVELYDRMRTGGRPRNYKSMSRQRRIEANARERTRVHTISAAFESLRRAVPAYAHNQKLSKLAILRIASAYIVALGCLNDQDYSQEQNKPSLSDCVEQCTRTIQAEGKSRRRTKD